MSKAFEDFSVSHSLTGCVMIRVGTQGEMRYKKGESMSVLFGRLQRKTVLERG